jgi:hypothetical protein
MVVAHLYYSCTNTTAMKKKNTKKLRLEKHTISRLQQSALHRLKGGGTVSPACVTLYPVCFTEDTCFQSCLLTQCVQFTACVVW